MTAEIVVMNREAVALAADSAVTSTMEGGQKIFTSADKIFALSDRYPVGIMFYNNARFMGIPWETIIKSFRSQLPKEGFATLEDYAKCFISFFENNRTFFGSDLQKRFMFDFVLGYFLTIKDIVENNVQSFINEHGLIDDRETRRVVSKVIANDLQEWMEVEPETVSSITSEVSTRITNKYKKVVREAIKEAFQELPISPKSTKQLYEIVNNLLFKGSSESTSSGVVIAGFGEREVFPSLVSFIFDGVFNNTLKYSRLPQSSKVGEDTDGSIIAFAQREMVSRFMEGVDPLYLEAEQGLLSELPKRFAQEVVSRLAKYDDSERQVLNEQLVNSCEEIIKNIQQQMNEMRDEQFTNPITGVVSLLPKTELGRLAESLVSLTSIKRRFSLESETVAEPIDVAVISKGDGFIWMKRKHYFQPELNPSFFARRYEGRICQEHERKG